MPAVSSTPSILVTIGCQTRRYFAFVTTAPVTDDSPATVTLHVSTFSDVSALAAKPMTLDVDGGQRQGRLVLIEAMELRSQRAKYLRNQHLLLAAHPALMGLSTLQQWLWHRLQSPAPDYVPLTTRPATPARRQ